MMFLLKYWKIAGAVSLLAVLLITHYKAFDYGVQKTNAKLANKVIESNINAKKGADNVRKKEQSLDVIRLNHGLCGLAIVRESAGCDKQLPSMA